jgi:hypothetical protein
MALRLRDQSPSVSLKYSGGRLVLRLGSTENTGAAADSGDPDGDGSVNLNEFTAGTVPTDAADVLRITSAAGSGGAFTVTLPGRTGRSYQLLRGSDPSAASWESIVTRGPAVAEGPVTLTDPAAPAGRAFYRVAVSRP